jgi:hypothetical protein
MAKITAQEEKALLEFFITLNESYRFPDESNTIEPSQIKLLRSYLHLKEKIFSSSFIKEIELLKAKMEGQKSYLPTFAEYNSEIIFPLLQNVNETFPYVQAGLTFSSPVAYPKKISINITFRCFDETNRLKLKIKTGVYVDDDNNFFWETGVIYTEKSLHNITKNIALHNVRSPISAKMICNSVDSLMKLLLHRPEINSLDLTPAFYHIIPLSLRAGGTFLEKPSFEEYRLKLFDAIHYSIFNQESYMKSINTPLYSYVRENYDIKNPKPLLISLLLYNKMVLDPANNSTFLWKSPRIYRYR